MVIAVNLNADIIGKSRRPGASMCRPPPVSIFCNAGRKRRSGKTVADGQNHAPRVPPRL
jgi:hypothetical protein